MLYYLWMSEYLWGPDGPALLHLSLRRWRCTDGQIHSSVSPPDL